MFLFSASELPEWARNLISNLANERDFWKKQSTEYESSVIVEKHVNDFVPGNSGFLFVKQNFFASRWPRCEQST